VEGTAVLRLIAAAGTVWALLVPASGAFAATATIAGDSGATVDYRAAAGEANVVTASISASTVTIADSGATLTPGSGCATVDPHTVQCTTSSVPAKLAAELGDGDDALAVSGTLDTFADGGAGNDRLTTDAGNDALIGGSGADSLTGGAGSDTLTGDGFAATAPGDDTLDGGPGADVMDGDDGVDTANYSGRTTAILVRLDGLAGDGGAEDPGGDNVDTENVALARATTCWSAMMPPTASGAARAAIISTARAGQMRWRATRGPTSSWAATETTRWTERTVRPTRCAATRARPTQRSPTAPTSSPGASGWHRRC